MHRIPEDRGRGARRGARGGRIRRCAQQWTGRRAWCARAAWPSGAGRQAMRAALSTYEVVRPRDLGGALRVLAERRLTPLAGATDLLVDLNAGTYARNGFLDLWALRELRG